MPELWEVKGAAKIRLFGPKDALDRVQTPAGVSQGRVAPDELLWLGDPEQAGALEAEGQKQLAGAGERGLVVDNSDGWALFSIVGDGRADALARLSSLRLPDEGFRRARSPACPARSSPGRGASTSCAPPTCAGTSASGCCTRVPTSGLTEGTPPASAAVSKAAEGAVQ